MKTSFYLCVFFNGLLMALNVVLLHTAERRFAANEILWVTLKAQQNEINTILSILTKHSDVLKSQTQVLYPGIKDFDASVAHGQTP